MNLALLLCVLNSGQNIIISLDRTDGSSIDLFEGTVAVARESFPGVHYDVVYISVNQSRKMVNILVKE